MASSTTRPWILGLSAAHHNGAACLMRGEELVVAIQEERLTRLKRARLPLDGSSLAVKYCLDAAGIEARDVDIVVLCSIRSPTPSTILRPALLDAFRPGVEYHYIPHHLGHALSAWMTSGFEETVALVIDGAGSYGWELLPAEREACLGFDAFTREHLSIYLCSGTKVVPVEKHLSDMPYLRAMSREPAGGRAQMMPFASLGHMYSSVSMQIFGDYLEAGKVMALASYGTARFSPDDFFGYDGRQFTFKDTVPRAVSIEGRWPLHQTEYYDLSTAVQDALEHALSLVVRRIESLTRNRRLCYSGGVALNSVANHRTLRRSSFSDIHIIAAAEDSGPAIGAAYHGFLQTQTQTPKRAPRGLRTDFLGHSYADTVDATISGFPGVEVVPTADLAEQVVDLLCDGNIVGWFFGGSEFGPRSLGHRAILCDARRSDAKKTLNERVKFREAFRPFAPCIMEDALTDWFAVDQPTQPMAYMLEICRFRDEIAESQVPGAMHVDRTGRLQTVTRDGNPELYALLDRFRTRTGVPMLINTSLNIMGEPIVETPAQALWLLLTTGVDYCVIDGRLVRKTLAPESILSLVPYATCTIKSSESGLSVVASMTEHGVHEYVLPDGLANAIRHVDGKTPVREIIQRLPPELLATSTPMKVLTQLQRYSMIRFTRI